MDRKLLILHAEDDQDDVLLIHKEFAKAGIQPIHTSPDGEDAMKYLEGTGPYADRTLHPYPDLLITDLKMPKVTGFDLLEWLDSHPDCRLPAIVLSGSAEPTDIERAYQLGACSYVVKPGRPGDLEAFVSAVTLLWGSATARRPRSSSI